MTMTRKTITIPGAMDQWIKAQIDRGRYGSDSEYVRDLIRRDQDYQAKLAALRSAIQEGRESGEAHGSLDEIMTEAQTEIDAGL